VLRLRNALEHAARRHRLGLLVVLYFALLLAVFSFHSAEHGVDEGAVALTCAVIVLVAAGLRAVAKPPRPRVRFEPFRPAPVRTVALAAPLATESPPGFSPLRL
jgi:peptidoglycan/LPS O-acetylase OafA/YrhL